MIKKTFRLIFGDTGTTPPLGKHTLEAPITLDFRPLFPVFIFLSNPLGFLTLFFNQPFPKGKLDLFAPSHMGVSVTQPFGGKKKKDLVDPLKKQAFTT